MNEIYTVIDSRTLEEKAPLVTSAFPYRTDIADMANEPGRAYPWHWHGEVEVFCMTEGELIYRLPGREVVFLEGDVGFINANVLHMTIASGAAACRQQEHVFLPQLVGGAPGDAIEENYVSPLLRNAAADCIRIPVGEESAAHARAQLDRAFELFYARPAGYEMRVRACMSEVWLAFSECAPPFRAVPARGDPQRIKAMLQYIDRNYSEPLTLEDIAAAAQVGVREASRCFRRQLNMSAFEYLMDVRVERAADLLRHSALTITEIGERCGFSSPSYFGKEFRRRIGETPSAYRKRTRG